MFKMPMDMNEAHKCFDLIIKVVDSEGICTLKGNILKALDRTGNSILASPANYDYFDDCAGNYVGSILSTWPHLLYNAVRHGLYVATRSNVKQFGKNWRHIDNFKHYVKIPPFSSYEELMMKLAVLGYEI